MTTGSKAFIKRFVRHSKSDPLVDEVKIIHVNPNYAQVRCPNGREMTVSLRNLAPCLQEDIADEEPDSPLTPVNNEEASNLENDLPSKLDEVTPQSNADDESCASPNFVPRRSSRINKGVPLPLWCRTRITFIFLEGMNELCNQQSSRIAPFLQRVNFCPFCYFTFRLHFGFISCCFVE